MIKTTIVLMIALAPSIAVAAPQDSADSAATMRVANARPTGIDVTLGADNRLAVSVPAGLSVVFWNRAGMPTEVKTSGRVPMRPGSYSVQAGNQTTICRVWAHGTAPPAAVDEMPIVRGQNHHNWLWRLDSLTPCAIIVTGIGLAVWGAASAS